eukprot:CAMPEP_0180637888 /NCGR_PEP_ID=MMETSP1037_2-20121125/43948_1 /TAXON_ID=632150 /ORGANISM="Azadinium spinosum, Strain 3D9" /LENGTH=90 /DNA_ID=CAMNT_0022659213 /DNA_START=55 /DNA_END=327 /DNA_ORIENTATION=-
MKQAVWPKNTNAQASSCLLLPQGRTGHPASLWPPLVPSSGGARDPDALSAAAAQASSHGAGPTILPASGHPLCQALAEHKRTLGSQLRQI